MALLNQLIAIEKGVKSRVYSVVTDLHNTCQKAALFIGLTKTYTRRDDTTEELPPENKNVSANMRDVLRRLENSLTEYLDIAARKDWSNCVAKADVKVDDKVIIPQAPITFLLHMEKQLTDLRTFIDSIPELDQSERWTYDENTGLYVSQPVSTHRTKKVQRPIVLYDATDKHPAQTQLINEDILAGHWQTIKQSGGIPRPDKVAMHERCEKLLNAVKFAREKANTIEEVSAPRVGTSVFNYVLRNELPV